MLDPRFVVERLASLGVRFYAGVPDSLLKHFCACVDATLPPDRHVIAANEGGAVALAAGMHLATGEVPAVYLQNSGLGNAVNPLLSLADPEVYGIPMVLIIGWRGEPGVPDEPQHRVQGRVTPALLETMGIPAQVLARTLRDATTSLARVVEAAVARSGPAALLVGADTFEAAPAVTGGADFPLSREEAIGALVDVMKATDVVLATTGKASRELFERRVRDGADPGRDFLTVGSMGHVSQLALGVAMGRPERRVVCLDGDGSVLMHTGGLAIIGSRAPANLVHVVLNNGAHESVGGQATVGLDVDLCAVALGFGYRQALKAETAAEIGAAWDALTGIAGPTLLEVRVRCGSRKDLGRPTHTPAAAKVRFREHLEP